MFDPHPDFGRPNAGLLAALRAEQKATSGVRAGFVRSALLCGSEILALIKTVSLVASDEHVRPLAKAVRSPSHPSPKSPEAA